MFYIPVIALFAIAAVQATPFHKNTTTPCFKDALRVETHINGGPSLEMVSSLIIGSEAAVLIDMPLLIPQAMELADWIRNTTDKPLIAVFTTHFHPDHYLSGSVLLEQFPNAKYYANSRAVALIANEAQQKSDYWSALYGSANVSQTPTIPSPYDFTFLALPSDEMSPIHLLSPLGGDTVDETLFWIPSIRTLIAGDAVYSNSLHPWMADLLTPVITESWITTLDFIASLSPVSIIPGHASVNGPFRASEDLLHTKDYVEFWQREIEAMGPDAFTPEEIFQIMDKEFPGLLAESTSALLLNITSENFGRGGLRQTHYVDLTTFNDARVLDGYEL